MKMQKATLNCKYRLYVLYKKTDKIFLISLIRGRFVTNI